MSREIEILLSELLIYIQSQNVWLKDCVLTFDELLNTTENLFQRVFEKYGKQSTDIPQTKTLFANVCLLFVWKMLALDEDGGDAFALTYLQLVKFSAPQTITVEMLANAEHKVLHTALLTTYIEDGIQNKPDTQKRKLSQCNFWTKIINK